MITILVAFLAGFYFGVFTVSLMVIAGRKKEKEGKEIHLLKHPQARQAAHF